MANIAEGFGRNGATESDFERLYGLVESIRRLIGGFIRYLEANKNHKLETRN